MSRFARLRVQELTAGRLGAAALRRFGEIPHLFAWWGLDRRALRNRQRLRGFRERHRGKRAFVLGNGPSLRHVDLSLLAREITFGANRVYLLAEEAGFLPTYYVCSNELVLEQFHLQIEALPIPKFLNWNRRGVFPHEREDIVFFRTGLQVADRFGRDAARTISSGGTVTFVSLQLAFFMGFREVILVGVDHDFADCGTPNVTAVRRTAEDRNHFHPDYFPLGSKWQLPDLLRSEIAYSLARAAYEADGRRILDATVGGKCPVFERVDWDSLF